MSVSTYDVWQVQSSVIMMEVNEINLLIIHQFIIYQHICTLYRCFYI
jgi:hypothetical protein